VANSNGNVNWEGAPDSTLSQGGRERREPTEEENPRGTLTRKPLISSWNRRGRPPRSPLASADGC